MKYVILLMLVCSSNLAMQEFEKLKEFVPPQSIVDDKAKEMEMLKKLADERSNLSFKDFQESARILINLKRQENNLLVTKALWGIARACHSSYVPESLALAEILIQAGADPRLKIKVEDIVQLRKKDDGENFYYTSMDYETSVMETANGSFKQYLETRPKT